MSVARPSKAKPNDRTSRRPESADEAKGLERLFLALAHAALIDFVFVVVTEDVQDTVRHQVGDFALGRVAELEGLLHCAWMGDHDVAEIGWLVRWDGERRAGRIM